MNYYITDIEQNAAGLRELIKILIASFFITIGSIAASAALLVYLATP